MVDLDAPDGDRFPGWQNAKGYMARAPAGESQEGRIITPLIIISTREPLNPKPSEVWTLKCSYWSKDEH